VTTPHRTTLHYFTLHYRALLYTALHYLCTTVHYITLHYTTLHFDFDTTLHYITLHYTTLHCIMPHYTTLRYITLHYTTLHYLNALHCKPVAIGQLNIKIFRQANATPRPPRSEPNLNARAERTAPEPASLTCVAVCPKQR
jgi:hypothetical protein